MPVEQEQTWTLTGGGGLVRHASDLSPRHPPPVTRGHRDRMVGMDHAAPPSQDTSTLEDFIRQFPMGDLNKKMGVRLLEVSAERVVGTMPVTGNTQPYGLLHGGASVVLAESLGSVGSAVHAQPDRQAVGVDINATHHRSAREGIVTGTATAVHLGRSSACYEVVITDEQERRLCTARITCALVPVRSDG